MLGQFHTLAMSVCKFMPNFQQFNFTSMILHLLFHVHCTGSFRKSVTETLSKDPTWVFGCVKDKLSRMNEYE